MVELSVEFVVSVVELVVGSVVVLVVGNFFC